MSYLALGLFALFVGLYLGSVTTIPFPSGDALLVLLATLVGALITIMAGYFSEKRSLQRERAKNEMWLRAYLSNIDIRIVQLLDIMGCAPESRTKKFVDELVRGLERDAAAFADQLRTAGPHFPELVGPTVKMMGLVKLFRHSADNDEVLGPKHFAVRHGNKLMDQLAASLGVERFGGF